METKQTSVIQGTVETASRTTTSSSSLAPPPTSSSSSSASFYHAPSPHSKPAVHVAPKPVAKPADKPYVASIPAAPKSESYKAAPPSAPVTSGNQWCMTYSPYTSSGGCKDAGSVASDIEMIASKGFSSIRLYSTDCSGLTNVGSAAQKHGLKLVLGVFISETGIEAAKPQIGEITSWANSAGGFSGVEMVVIGNEAVFNKYCSASDLASFISNAKSSLKAAGYSGPVTTTEPINVLSENAATLCPAVDCLAANIHPFFNAAISASDAGEFVATELAMLEKTCPGKQMDAYNLETGWPHQGQSNGAAVPGTAEQQEAIQGIMKHAGGKSAFFSFVDDLWKAEGEFAVEQSWGCSQLFGH